MTENPTFEHPATLTPTEDGACITTSDTYIMFDDLDTAAAFFAGILRLDQVECAIAGPNPGQLHIYSNQEI